MHFLKMARSVFRILNHYNGLCGGFFPSISAGGLEMRAVSCVGVMKAWPMLQKPILNTLCGSQKEAAKHAQDKMVAIKELLNR